MKIFHPSALAGLALLAVLSATEVASAANGFATTNVNQRAGPGVDYPVVVTIPAGSPVNIFGCLNQYGWCDVEWYGNRGWVAGSYLQADYQSQRVPFVTYAPYLGVPVVAFNFDNYWDSYYRARPWYGDRYRWRGGPVPYAAPVARPPYYGPGPTPYYGPKPYYGGNPYYGNAPAYGPGYKGGYGNNNWNGGGNNYGNGGGNKNYGGGGGGGNNYGGGGGGGNNYGGNGGSGWNKGGGNGGNGGYGGKGNSAPPAAEADNNTQKKKCFWPDGSPRPCSMNPNLKPN